MIFFTAGRLFSDSRAGLKFQFCLDSVPNWLTNTYWGLWPLLEFVGVLVAILCMVKIRCEQIVRHDNDLVMCV